MPPSASRCGSQMQSGLVSWAMRSFRGVTCTGPPVYDVAARLYPVACGVGVDESGPVECAALRPEQTKPPSVVREDPIPCADVPAPKPHC